jgi:hypothetical protein
MQESAFCGLSAYHTFYVVYALHKPSNFFCAFRWDLNLLRCQHSHELIEHGQVTQKFTVNTIRIRLCIQCTYLLSTKLAVKRSTCEVDCFYLLTARNSDHKINYSLYFYDRLEAFTNCDRSKSIDISSNETLPSSSLTLIIAVLIVFSSLITLGLSCELLFQYPLFCISCPALTDVTAHDRNIS